MRISKNEKKNYVELFKNYELTDPELIEIFENFAFDEVVSYGNLSEKDRVMVILASLIASQGLGQYKIMLDGALDIGITQIEVKEIVYQAVPYVGMAKVFEFINITNEILDRRGVKLPLEGQSTTSLETRYEKGLKVQKDIFGDVIDNMYKQSPANQIHIQKYLSANCFGDYYTRTGLDIKTRELLTFSMILSLGGCESQLKAHIVGNLNVGNDKEVLLSVVTQLIPYVGYPRSLNAIACLNEIIPENK
ncbi:carboxymuconolactone decarboxylase family protein [Clostridium mediterraneense]|uniref:carboxymuconolactone decarboxylase family protein n=1 Tax=Clostridium mediterraneense TaxID=1805472 RepID=UPI00082E2285|nr:carboxymuconolactone decarboxylase family protein [Clostridium mediterraneense]